MNIMIMLASLAFSVGVVLLVYCVGERSRQYSTTEWRARMRELGIGVRRPN